MRLFSALAVPAPVAQDLAQFRGGLPNAKWVDPTDFHVTLAFFGELDRPVAEDLAQALAEIELAAFEVRLLELGVFGADRPHAIIVRAERTPPLLALEAAHRAAMDRVGLESESRKYSPHVTLARLRRTTAGDVAGWMSDQPAFQPQRWRAPSFTLFSSRTSRGGGPYVSEVEFGLREDHTTALHALKEGDV